MRSCSNISLKTVKNALKGADIKGSLHRVGKYPCPSNECASDLTMELRSLSINVNELSDPKETDSRDKLYRSRPDDPNVDKCFSYIKSDGLEETGHTISPSSWSLQRSLDHQELNGYCHNLQSFADSSRFGNQEDLSSNITMQSKFDSQRSNEYTLPHQSQLVKSSSVHKEAKRSENSFSKTTASASACGVSEQEAFPLVENYKTCRFSSGKENYVLSNSRMKCNKISSDADSSLKSPSSSSSSSSGSSSSSETSSAGSESGCESESYSSDDESQNEEHVMYREKSANTRGNYGKKNSELREEANGYSENSGYNPWVRDASCWDQYSPYPWFNQTHMNPHIPENHGSSNWHNPQYRPPYIPSYPSQWNYPYWYSHFPYYSSSPSATDHWRPQFESSHPSKATMDSLLEGKAEETDGLKMKEMLKCQFDYLKYMKTT